MSQPGYEPSAELIELATAWVGGYVAAFRGRVPSGIFIETALRVMPPQVLDLAMERWNLELDIALDGMSYFQHTHRQPKE